MNRTLLFLFVAFFHAATLLAGDPLDQILADWKSRYERFESFEYRCEGTMFQPRGSLWQDASEEELLPPDVKGPVPAEDFQSDVKLTLLIDLKEGRFRRESDKPAFHVNRGRYGPDWERILFDGQEYQSYTPREKNTRDGIRPFKYQPDFRFLGRQTPRGQFGRDDWPILLSHGYLPIPGSPIDPAVPLRRPPRDRWMLRGTTKVDGVECDILQLEDGKSGTRFLQYWVARSQRSAVHRLQWVVNDKQVGHIEIQYEPEENEWLVSRWRYVWPNEKIDNRLAWVEYAVKQWRLNVALADETFHMSPQPGWVVNDLRTKETYIQGEPGKPDVPITDEMRQLALEESQVQ